MLHRLFLSNKNKVIQFSRMHVNHTIRKYHTADKVAVLEILRANTPTFFSPEEESGLVYYLDNEIEEYYVMLVDDQIIGSGGVNYENNRTIGIISWGMIHPDYHGKYLGTELLKYRIRQLQKNKTVERITESTSQHVYRFYEKQGFKLLIVVKDYWAQGIDLYEMQYEGKEAKAYRRFIANFRRDI